MNTALKVAGIVVLTLVAIKRLPIALALGVIILGMAGAVAAFGLSIVAALFAVSLGLLALLAPIWLPVLAIVAIVACCRRSNARPAGGA